jgi:hypothetical protein
MNIYVDSTGTLNLVFTDFSGAAATPSTVALTIYDSLGTVNDTKDLTDLQQDTPPVTGHYHYHHDIASTDPMGVWRIECKASVDDGTGKFFDEVSVITWEVMVPGSQWVSAGRVKQYALVNYTALNYVVTPPTPFANEYEFDTFLDRFLIPAAQEHVNSYCRRDFNVDYTGSTIPQSIRDVCARAAANMIQYMVMNRMGPLVTTGAGYKLRIPTQEVLPVELQELLKPWVEYTVPIAVTRWGD